MSLTLKVAKTPALASLIHTVLFTGTKRARRKAVSLIRLCQMFEPAVGTATPPLGGGRALEYTMDRSGSGNTGLVAGDLSSVGISVHVL
ncbi:hypothetical protein HPP92_007717 [Vanilla planifolia]|uniref:Uncharacterized protein n=1 Tax=Vanilla planifolia TaxID=51239 RepID=A0A835V7Y9_VANPL|nr:hypothetical protein HPP92_007717 [Vanilla planifolia]